MKISVFLISAAMAATLAGGAHAASFAPASGGVAYLGAPTVTTGATAGTEAFNEATFIFGETGSLTAATGTGFANGTLAFSNTPDAVVTESLPSFLTFADNKGGNFTFDVSSVETLAYTMSPSSSSFTLYLLGSAGDTTLGLTPSPTSVTITSNSTGPSVFSASASISSPPSLISAAPEPSSWALMIAGVFGIGLALRQAGRGRKMTSQAVAA